MGTRSLTFVKDESGKSNLCMYRQMDGYPTGHGQELKDFLKDMVIINGIGMQKGPIANGMGCLAAQIVAHFKDGVGSIYLYPTSTKDAGQEFSYGIYAIGDRVGVKILRDYDRKILYNGPIADADMEAIENEGTTEQIEEQ